MQYGHFASVEHALATAREQIDFLERERRYALNVCLPLERQDYYRDCLRRLEVIGQFIRRAYQALEVISSNWQQDEAVTNRAVEILGLIVEHLPRIFHTISESLTQRRQLVIRTSYVGVPHYSFADVHPDYPLTIRALESIVRDFYSTFSPILGSSGIPQPLVSMSEKTSFEYVSPGTDLGLAAAWAGGGVRSLQPADYLSLLTSGFVLSEIGAPRWTPVTMRCSPIIAHEIAHMILDMADLLEHTLSDSGKVNGNGEEDLSRLFSRRFVEFIRVTAKIRELFLSFMKEFEPKDEEPYITANLRKEMRRQAYEIMADFLALVTAGPAFLYAHVNDVILDPTWVDVSDHGFAEKYHKVIFATGTHPPDLIRLESLETLARQFGWNGYADFIFNSANVRSIKHSMENQISSYPTCAEQLQAYREWLANSLGDILSLRELLKKPLPEAQALGFYEENLLRDVSDYIITQFDKGNVFLSDYSGNSQVPISPSLLLTALWHKICHKPELPNFGIRWRQGIVYSAQQLTQRIIQEGSHD